MRRMILPPRNVSNLAAPEALTWGLPIACYLSMAEFAAAEPHRTTFSGSRSASLLPSPCRMGTGSGCGASLIILAGRQRGAVPNVACEEGAPVMSPQAV